MGKSTEKAGKVPTIGLPEGHLGHTSPLDGELRHLPRRPALVVAPSDTVRDTMLHMNLARSDAAVVVDGESRLPLGIVSLFDLAQAIAVDGCSLDQPIAMLMTAAPITLPADAPVHRATVLMSKQRLPHIVLVENDGRLCNLVSQADVFGLRGGGAEALAEAVSNASDVDSLAQAAQRVRARGAGLFAAGMGVEVLSEWMSSLNDLVVMRVIELIEDEFDLPPVPWCWLAFGSEGRLEQTFSTDQDNGLVFVPEDAGEAETVRAAFTPFARAVNDGLHACGFTHCPGNVMARNPRWCLSLAEWQDRFSSWMRTPEPEAILNSTIFFDFRPLYGRYELADKLRSWLLASAPTQTLFLRTLAEQALSCRPPLGWMGTFTYDGGKKHPHTIDLKLYGSRPFVDIGRLWSLAHGIWATNTATRLRSGGAAIGRPADDTAAAIEAFYLVQRFRIQQQIANPDRDSANRLNPAALNDLNRLMLKHAFKQAKKLQRNLQLEYEL